MEENYEIFDRNRQCCCGRIPRPLKFITDLGKIKNYSDRAKGFWFPYAFECSDCGLVYAVLTVSTPHEMMGDFMQCNYTRWYDDPKKALLRSKPLLRLYHSYINSNEVLTGERSKVLERLNEKINELEKSVGRLEEKQRRNVLVRDKLLWGELQGIDGRISELKEKFIIEARDILGLPRIKDPKGYEKRELLECQKKIDNLGDSLADVGLLQDLVAKKEDILKSIGATK